MIGIIEKIKEAKGYGAQDMKKYEETINQINKKAKELADNIIKKYSKNKQTPSNTCEKEVPKENILDYSDLEYDIKKHSSKPNVYCVNKKIQK